MSNSWTGCKNLQTSVSMCLSPGTPAMPSPDEGAVCGPRVPGTQKPAAGVSLSSLNPCPLNACCSQWGRCGPTAEHCAVSGTGAPGTTGCISNCGTEIVNNETPPSESMSVAYFQAYNRERPCLNMDVTSVDKSTYTHIHFSFATLTQDYEVNITSVQYQFVKFTQMTGIKKILAFGGWAFSTEPDTYMIFRNGILPENREVLATKISDFITLHGLDGVDIDWEYPGAPDIPGIPPGASSEGAYYASFLELLKNKLSNKSVSIAAPASFWYLQAYPMGKIGSVVDYIIYMTYDFHGLYSLFLPNLVRTDVYMSRAMGLWQCLEYRRMPRGQLHEISRQHDRDVQCTHHDHQGRGSRQ